jgi:hypothetical protein
MYLNHNSGCPTLAKPGWGIVCGSKRPPSSNFTPEAR